MRIVSFSFRHVAYPTTIKHQNFVNSPMGTVKPVTALPGIGKIWGGQLMENGFGLASQIFGQYLSSAQNRERFTSLVQQNCGIGTKRAWGLYSALDEWSQQYFI